MTRTSSSSAPLIVVDDPARWPFRIRGVEVVAARAYLTDARYAAPRRATVFNLSRSYRYQSTGYYVSLLAAARGHRPKPGVRTIEEMKSRAVLNIVSEDLETLIHRSLHRLRSKEFELSIYFGRNLAKRYDALATRLAAFFEAPLLRARFVRNGRWQLRQLRPITVSDVPESHRPEILRFAHDYFARQGPTARGTKRWRYDLALLLDPAEEEPPSDDRAIRRFERAARGAGLRTERITRDDYGRVGEFDALFIRETTAVNHHTYRFAQRAAAKGLVVLDDPESIVRCTNKVYLAESAERRGIATPETRILHRGNFEELAEEFSYPRVLKQPDSSFSAGVVRVDGPDEFRSVAGKLLSESELIVAQAYMRTDYDWRIGVLGGHPLYACRYHMASGHWQIINRGAKTRGRYGRVEAVPLEEVPSNVLRCAVRSSKLMGSGLYGVDLKSIGRRCVLVEVNDNPTIESGCEDAVLGPELYERIAGWFLRRLDERTR